MEQHQEQSTTFTVPQPSQERLPTERGKREGSLGLAQTGQTAVAKNLGTCEDSKRQKEAGTIPELTELISMTG